MPRKLSINTFVLDTNVWISSFVQSDAFHYEGKRTITRLLSRNFLIVIPQPVILEIINVLSKKGFSKGKIQGVIKEFYNNKKFKIVLIETEKLIEISLRNLHVKALSSEDYYIFIYVILINPSHFISFDKKLQTVYNQNNKK